MPVLLWRVTPSASRTSESLWLPVWGGHAASAKPMFTFLPRRFFVQRMGGGKITDEATINEIKVALEVVLKAKTTGRLVVRPRFESETKRISTLMGGS